MFIFRKLFLNNIFKNRVSKNIDKEVIIVEGNRIESWEVEYRIKFLVLV